MTRSRRTVLATGAAGLVAVLAGCTDVLFGDGPLEFEADQAAPSDSSLEEAEFEEFEVTEESIEETVGSGDVEREVTARYWVSTYTREIEVGEETREGAAFAAVSTPDASVAGQSFNPIAEMDNEEIIEEYRGEMGGQQVENIEHEDTTTIESLGEDRDVDIFTGEREYEGETIELDILVSSFEHEDDYLVVLGIYPQMDSLREAAGITHEDDEDFDESALPDDLDEAVETLFEGLEHPV